MTGEDLGVTFDANSALFALEFRTGTALLNLCQARDLAAVLTGTLDGWRPDVHLPARGQPRAD